MVGSHCHVWFITASIVIAVFLLVGALFIAQTLEVVGLTTHGESTHLLRLMKIRLLLLPQKG